MSWKWTWNSWRTTFLGNNKWSDCCPLFPCFNLSCFFVQKVLVIKPTTFSGQGLPQEQKGGVTCSLKQEQNLWNRCGKLSWHMLEQKKYSIRWSCMGSKHQGRREKKCETYNQLYNFCEFLRFVFVKHSDAHQDSRRWVCPDWDQLHGPTHGL